mmetsp:Transcript_63278/g.150924  ORF Transcript_63278/g.150924 Transcript_63278/m.150924 type:complete len:220 (-) Transcript_63278:120-779(-)
MATEHLMMHDPNHSDRMTVVDIKVNQVAGNLGSVGGTNVQARLEDTERSNQVIRALRIPTDPRYREIKHYTEAGKESHCHFARMQQRMLKSKSMAVDGSTATASQADEVDVASINYDELEKQVGDRLAWQETFDRSVKRLMVDFSLSEEPQCRLHHLERLHDWFTEHGAKTVRKAAAAPNFLTMDLDRAPPPGSTRNFRGPSSNNPLSLAGAFQVGGRR